MKDAPWLAPSLRKPPTLKSLLKRILAIGMVLGLFVYLLGRVPFWCIPLSAVALILGRHLFSRFQMIVLVIALGILALIIYGGYGVQLIELHVLEDNRTVLQSTHQLIEHNQQIVNENYQMIESNIQNITNLEQSAGNNTSLLKQLEQEMQQSQQELQQNKQDNQQEQQAMQQNNQERQQNQQQIQQLEQDLVQAWTTGKEPWMSGNVAYKRESFTGTSV